MSEAPSNSLEGAASSSSGNSVSRWIAGRYLFAGQHQYARFISWVSLIGIGLGVAVLILVLSVMNGFDRELTSRILGTVPHVLIQPEVSSDEQLMNALAEFEADNPSIAGTFGFFQSQAMVTRRSSVSPVAIYGVDEQGLQHLPMLTQNADVDLVEALQTPRAIVLGAPLARSLGLLPGDWVLVMVTTATDSRVKPQFERFQLAGTFEVGAELDYGLALVDLSLMREPSFAATGKFGTRLMLDDPYAAPELADRLSKAIAASGVGAVKVSHWGETYGELFRAVKLEKAMMFVLLVLIVGIAAFNVVAGQAMLVNDKRGDIGILRTMGASDGTVLRIFLLQGFLTSLVGVFLGVLLGCILAWNITALVAWVEGMTGVRVLEGTYFLEVPSQLLITDVLAVVALALGIGALAAFFPAYRSLAVNPVNALHE